ncbi:J domain-containing protein [Thermodesulfobacteriota bacterium]
MKINSEIISTAYGNGKKKKCLSCGAALDNKKKRYCSKACKDLLIFALRWLKNLLLALHTKYATFSFSEYLLIINVRPHRSNDVFSYFYKRTPGKAPAEDLKKMCIELSREWYNKNKQTNCRVLASIHILNKGQKGVISKDLIKPMVKKSKSNIKKQLISLKLSVEDIDDEGSKEKIKAAYRKEALKTHPDVGGDEEKFKSISEAYQELISWLKNPHFIIRRGVPGKWSYDGRNFKWRTPL